MDIFDILNGGGRRPRQKRKTKDIYETLEVTLEDVYLGKEKHIEIARKRLCTKCKGSGSKIEGASTTCTRCKGNGAILVLQRTPIGVFQTEATCPTCQGEGSIIKDSDRCPEYKGGKITTQSKLLKVMLDKGALMGRDTFSKGRATKYQM